MAGDGGAPRRRRVPVKRMAVVASAIDPFAGVDTEAKAIFDADQRGVHAGTSPRQHSAE